MAKLVEADSRGIQRGPIGSAPRLPPRIPSNPGRGLLLSDLSTGIFGNQSYEGINQGQGQHKRTPSCNMVMQEQPLWLDDLLDDLEVPSKKGSHRRSASDSFTYLENARGQCTFGNIDEVDEAEYGNLVAAEKLEQRRSSSSITSGCGNMAEVDDVEYRNLVAAEKLGQRRSSSLSTSGLSDLLDEIQQLQVQRNAPISALSQSAIARPDLSRGDDLRAPAAGQMKFVPEPKSGEDAETCCYDNASGNANLDPKKTKRQSAQRSRVRKLQYIAELERIVNALQVQVSSLSPQLLLFRHQCALLSMDNNGLQQKISLCMREKSIKDTQNETLSKEVQRLQALLELQAIHELQKQQQRHIHRHSSLPSDFDAQLRHYNEQLNANSQQSTPTTSSSLDMPPGITESENVSLGSC